MVRAEGKIGVMAISLNQQIDEVRRELEQRKEVYARMVATRKMRQSIAEFQTARMMAVLNTLEWLQRNEAKIKAFLGPDEVA
jgi:hypothetical protein